MSLTRHLGDTHSPIRAWFAAALGDTRPVVAEANRHLRQGPEPEPVGADVEIVTLRPQSTPPLASHAQDPALAGTALDLLVRVTLVPDALRDSAALVGAGRIVHSGRPVGLTVALEAL